MTYWPVPDLDISVSYTAAALGIGLGRLLSMEHGIPNGRGPTLYRIWLSRIEGGPTGERHQQLEGARAGSRFR